MTNPMCARGVDRRSVRMLACAGLAASVSTLALGDVKSYTSPVNSSWQSNLAWSPIGAPTTFDDLVFDRALGSFITFDTAVNSCRFHTYRRNTVNADVVGLHVVTGGMIIANTTNDATLNLRDGTMAVNATSTLGSVNGGHGILRLEEPDVEFSVNGTSSLFTVGLGGAGDVFINLGSVLRCDGPVVIGDLATASAAIHVTGSSPNIAGRRSKFETTTASGDVTIGDAGTGFVNVSDDGRLSVAGDVNMGVQPGSLGRINYSSVSSLIAGNLNMASRPGAAAAGEAILSITGGRLDVVGATNMGDPNGGDATITVNGGGVFRTGSLGMTTNHATLNILDGAVLILGGAFTPNFFDLTLNAATAAGEAELQFNQGGSLFMFGTLQCGATNRGRLTAAGSSTVTLAGGGGAHRLGLNPGGEAFVSSLSGSTIDLGGSLDAGVSGAATIRVDASATLRVGTALNLAVNPGSTATVTIEDGGDLIVGAGGIFIGGTQAAAGGSASVALANGGLMRSDGDILLRSGRTLSLTSSTVTAVDRFDADGVVTSTGGSINAELFDLGGTGTFTGSGQINARISGGGSYTLAGALTIGNSGSPTGVATLSSFAVGTHALTLRDDALATTGPITLAGGSLDATASARSTNLSGNGTVLCDYSPGIGIINATGAGLTFAGLLTNPNLTTIGGTRITFGATGGFTGAGTIAAAVATLPGSVITATGSLTMGSAANATGAAIGGDMMLTAGNVTLLDANGASIGGHVTFNGGILLTCANGLSMQPSAVIEGAGSLGANVQSAGRIKIRTTGIARAISINATFSQAPSGVLDIDLFSPTGANFLQVPAGNASLNGTLDVHASFTPTANARWTVLTCQSRTGTFSSAIFPAVPTGGFRVEYFPNRVDVVFCLSDFNGDGSLDPDDLSDYIACFFSTPPCPGADVNGDGNTDPDDLSDYIGAFFAGCA